MIGFLAMVAVLFALRWAACASCGFDFNGELTERGKRMIAREAFEDWVNSR